MSMVSGAEGAAHGTAGDGRSPASDGPPPDASPRASRGADVTRAALRVVQLGPVLMLVLIVLGFSILSEFFLTTRNLQNLGAQSSIVMSLALGQFLVVLIRGIDISVGAVIGFSAVAAATIVGSGGNGLLFVAVTLLAGGAVGIVNGLIIVKGQLPQPLIVTLATLGVSAGLAQLMTDGEAIVGLPSVVADLGAGKVGPIPSPVFIVAAIAAFLAYVTARSQLGRWLYALGGNPEGAARMGLPVGKITIAAYTACGLTAGVAGLIAAGRTDSATPLAGAGNELDAITAVVIGGASLFGGRGSVFNVVIGALILGTIRNGLDLLDVSPYMQQVTIGVIVVVALLLDVVRARLEERVKRATARAVER
jgi:ribose transport system permease protein